MCVVQCIKTMKQSLVCVVRGWQVNDYASVECMNGESVICGARGMCGIKKTKQSVERRWRASWSMQNLVHR